jgi:hypothetical protein
LEEYATEIYAILLEESAFMKDTANSTKKWSEALLKNGTPLSYWYSLKIKYTIPHRQIIYTQIK